MTSPMLERDLAEFQIKMKENQLAVWPEGIEMMKPYATDYGVVGIEEIAAIRRYVDHGILPGGFLQAVLRNDLRDALERADIRNIKILGAYVSYLMNEVPAACWGSPERVECWLGAWFPAEKGDPS